MHFTLVDLIGIAVALLLSVAVASCAAGCLLYRRLSPWLLVAAAGFLGGAGAIVVRVVAPLALNAAGVYDRTVIYSFMILANALVLLLFVVIAAGLGLEFADIRRRLDRASPAPALPPATDTW